MIHALYIIVASAAGMAALGWLFIALFGNHDPGQVFPWGFNALVAAVGFGFVGLFGSVTIIIAAWLLRWLLNVPR